MEFIIETYADKSQKQNLLTLNYQHRFFQYISDDSSEIWPK